MGCPFVASSAFVFQSYIHSFVTGDIAAAFKLHVQVAAKVVGRARAEEGQNALPSPAGVQLGKSTYL